MSEIVKAQPLGIPDQMKYAEIVTTGDLVPRAYQGKPANALLAIGLGQAMGLSPAEALLRIDVIQGKPSASAELIAANVRKAGHILRIETDEKAMSVKATIYRADDPEFPHVVTRDMEWAKAMGLTSKDQYKKQPLTMLEWRAISAVARKAASEALYGVTYTPDELKDMGERPAAPKVSAGVAALQDEPVDVATGEIVEERLAGNAVDADMRHDADQFTDVESLRALWTEARDAGASEETLTYIATKAKEATT